MHQHQNTVPNRVVPTSVQNVEHRNAGAGTARRYSVGITVYDHSLASKKWRLGNCNYLSRKPEVMLPIPRPPAGLMGEYQDLFLGGLDPKLVSRPSSTEVKVHALKTMWLLTVRVPEAA